MDQRRWNQIEELLQKALDLASGERPGFLETACVGDAELRSAVETLLKREEQARSFIETPAIAYGAFGSDATDSSFVGRSISHYRIESLIGIGGMGEVYQAQDENLKRTVAIKILPAEFTADPDRVRRFEQEAFAASTLNHPNIITIFEVVHSEPAHFIVSEYVEGRTLRELLKDPSDGKPRRLGVEQAISISAQIASALKASHTAWIIHRDIKPENIMVREDGLVKVLDFGIAKLGSGDKDSAPAGGYETPVDASVHNSMAGSLTIPGAVIGTASYMSPEQARGEPLDGRTDLFSLGAVLFEMVTGERLLGKATRGQAIPGASSEQEPLPSSYRFDRVPRELERIIRKLLRRDRMTRYASAGELMSELESLKHRLENRTSRRIARASAMVLLLVLSLGAIAAFASRGEVWDEVILRDGHTAAVRRAVFSPDGRLLVSVGEDKQVIVWDFEHRERLATLTDHTDWVRAVAFSPDGKRFATGSLDRTVIVWDALTLQQETVLRQPHKAASLAFSPDGKVLVVASDSAANEGCGTSLWRVGSWEQFAVLPNCVGEAASLLFPAGSQRLVFHYYTEVPNTWDVATGRPLRNDFSSALHDQNNVALSPDGTEMVGVCGRGNVTFADFRRRQVLSREKAHQDNGRAVAFSPQGRLVATGAENIILWDADTRRKITTIDYPSIVWSAVFSPDGRWLVTTHGDGAIRVWDVIERRRVTGFNEHDGPVRTVAWAIDGKRFASGGEDSVVMIWNAETGRRDMLLAGHPTRVTGLAFSSDGGTLVSVDREGLIIIWDLVRQRERRRFGHPGPQNIGYCLALSSDGRLVATSHGVYESDTGRQLVDFAQLRFVDHLPPGRVYGLAFSGDGTRLAVANSAGFQSICDTATWQLIERSDQSPRQFISVSFAPDGKELVTGEDGGTVQLWKAHPLSPTAILGRHTARNKAVVFSPDGHQVASAGDDNMIALWDASSPRLITRIGLHTAPVYAVAFSPDGGRLVSGGHDRSVRLYTRHHTLWGFRLD